MGSKRLSANRARFHFSCPARIAPPASEQGSSSIVTPSAPPRESVFKRFFEGLAVGAVQISPDGRFLEVNDRYCRLTGYGRQALLAMRVADLDHPADRAADRERWVQFLRDPSIGYDVEKRYVRADGSVIWVHATGAVIPQGDNEPPLIAKTVEDITTRVEATVVLRESEERLRDALAIKEEFLGLVSHELRTPLTVIVGMANVMARADLSVELMRETAGEIRESAEHLESLLESMLVLARADHAEAHEMEPIQLTHVLRRAVERHRAVYPYRPLRLECLTHEALIEGHEPWVSQIVGNLLSNAEKYSPAQGEIVVVLQREGRDVVVRVIDHGVGIAPDDLPLVFEPFYRAAHARERSSGLGLGLAVCKRLVELQGGRIWATSHAGLGSEFGFAFPALEVQD